MSGSQRAFTMSILFIIAMFWLVPVFLPEFYNVPYISLQKKLERIGNIVSPINFSEKERKQLDNILTKYALIGSEKELDVFVKSLQRKGKFGIITDLPQEYESEDVVNLEEKRILVPSE